MHTTRCLSCPHVYVFLFLSSPCSGPGSPKLLRPWIFIPVSKLVPEEFGFLIELDLLFPLFFFYRKPIPQSDSSFSSIIFYVALSCPLPHLPPPPPLEPLLASRGCFPGKCLCPALEASTSQQSQTIDSKIGCRDLSCMQETPILLLILLFLLFLFLFLLILLINFNPEFFLLEAATILL